MQQEACAGGIVIGDAGTIALVRRRDGDGAWLFPKGHIDADESDEAAARREVLEETGLADLEYIDDLGSYERSAINADGSENPSRRKRIHMFLFAAPMHAQLAPSLEIEEARWVPLPRLIEAIGNAADRAWFVSVFERVRLAVQRD